MTMRVLFICYEVKVTDYREYDKDLLSLATNRYCILYTRRLAGRQ